MKGIKHGKAKEYDKKGKLIFNGKYINGKKYQKNIKNNNYKLIKKNFHFIHFMSIRFQLKTRSDK